MQTDEFECPETKYCWSGEGNKREHVAVAERVLGKALPVGAIVHHANEDKSDNRHENLVICQDRAYHNLLHQRMRARAACGERQLAEVQHLPRVRRSRKHERDNRTGAWEKPTTSSPA
jgi:hypothetical protein